MHSVFIFSFGIAQGLAATGNFVDAGKKDSGKEFLFGLINTALAVLFILHGLGFIQGF